MKEENVQANEIHSKLWVEIFIILSKVKNDPMTNLEDLANKIESYLHPVDKKTSTTNAPLFRTGIKIEDSQPQERDQPVTAKTEQDAKELYKDMGEWSREAFPDSDSVGHLHKLLEETQEAINNPDNITEYADCLLVIMAAAYRAEIAFDHLISAAKDKLSINKTRKWERKENGIYQHKTEQEDEAPKHPTSWRDFTMTEQEKPPESAEEIYRIKKERIYEVIDALKLKINNRLDFTPKSICDNLDTLRDEILSLPVKREITDEVLDLQQYVTNLLYYAHVEAQSMDSNEFDAWVEREVNNIGEYASQKHPTDEFDKINCFTGYLERWRDNPLAPPPFELKDVINEANEWMRDKLNNKEK